MAKQSGITQTLGMATRRLINLVKTVSGYILPFWQLIFEAINKDISSDLTLTLGQI